jgi:hypothetical protein
MKNVILCIKQDVIMAECVYICYARTLILVNGKKQDQVVAMNGSTEAPVSITNLDFW